MKDQAHDPSEPGRNLWDQLPQRARDEQFKLIAFFPTKDASPLLLIGRRRITYSGLSRQARGVGIATSD